MALRWMPLPPAMLLLAACVGSEEPENAAERYVRAFVRGDGGERIYEVPDPSEALKRYSLTRLAGVPRNREIAEFTVLDYTTRGPGAHSELAPQVFQWQRQGVIVDDVVLVDVRFRVTMAGDSTADGVVSLTRRGNRWAVVR